MGVWRVGMGEATSLVVVVEAPVKGCLWTMGLSISEEGLIEDIAAEGGKRSVVDVRGCFFCLGVTRGDRRDWRPRGRGGR